MNIYKLDKLSHAAVSRLDRTRTAVLCAMSPIEVHGPHLPLGQDVFTAQALLERTVEMVAAERDDWSFVILHPVPVATDCVPELGSISYPVGLVRDVAYHTLEPFAKRGFTRLAFSSFHGGPRHNCALEDACERINKRYESAAVSLFSAVLGRIPEDFLFDAVKDLGCGRISRDHLVQDRHAGMVETSIGLHLWPELVDKGWEGLPPSISGETDQDGRPAGSFLFEESGKGFPDRIGRALSMAREIYAALRHFSESTYFGYPGLSSVEIGEVIFNRLVELSRDVVNEFLDKGKDMERHSPMWRLKDLLLNRGVNYIAEDWLHIFSD